jgi:hypothetical protein
MLLRCGDNLLKGLKRKDCGVNIPQVQLDEIHHLFTPKKQTTVGRTSFIVQTFVEVIHQRFAGGK